MSTDPFPGAPARVAEVPLSSLDATTVRAMCDAGYIDHALYVAYAREHGITLAHPVAAPPPTERPARAVPQPMGTI